MRLFIFAICVILTAGKAVDAHENNAFCKAPEIVSAGNVEYNENVCQALALLENGKFAEAAIILEKASNIPLFEMPNFMLEALRAEALYGLGDRQAGKYHLQKAELFLLVYSGIRTCTKFIDDPADSADLHYDYKDHYPEELVKEVANKLCWVGYEAVLNRPSFARIEHEYALLQRIKSVKEKYN